MNQIEVTEPIKSITIGEEFVDWAEQQNYFLSNDNESCPYNYIRTTFIQKIDEIIKNRIEQKSNK